MAETNQSRPPQSTTSAFRLPTTTRVGAVSLQVSDLNASRAYYEGVLGLRTAHRDAATAVLVADGDTDDRPLVHLRARPGIQPVPRGGTLGLYHFALLLPERADLGRFVAHVVDLGVRVGAADHLVSEAIYLTDPDGLGIEVYGDRPRHTWRFRDRDIQMATEPLDFGSLIAAGAGRRWTGLPHGTTMGHIHLHVGDLGSARHFYQDGVGFEVTTQSYPGALFFAAGGYHHHVGTNTWSSGRPATDAHARLLSWELVVPSDHDRDNVATSIRAAGYQVQRDGAVWTTADPSGTTLVIRSV